MYRKKVIFILALLISGFTVSAQFKKGTRMVNASLGSIFYNSGTADVSFPAPTTGYTSKSSSYGVNISPAMGWFISDNTAVGVTLNINPAMQKTTYEAGGTTFQKDEARPFSLGLGGFARNYFNTENSFMPFGHAGVNFGFSSRNTEGFFYGGSGPSAYKDSYEGKSSGGFFANATLQLGLTKMLNDHTGLDFFAGYNFSYSKNTVKTTTLRDDGINGSIDQTSVSEPTTQFTNHGFILGIGFQVFLEARK